VAGTMTGKTVVITGASSGIGAAAARELHAMGAEVVVVGRSPDKTKEIADELGTTPIVADFASLAQVRRAADEILDRCASIDVLANNAGLSVSTRQMTDDDHELTFQVNHLAPFLLTDLLLPRLIESAPSRIVNTSSLAHLGGFVVLRDLESRFLFNGSRTYATTKLQNILFTRELGRRLPDAKVLATSFNPGFVSTDLGRDDPIGALHRSPLRRLMRSPEEGADTLVWLAAAPSTELTQGAYYTDRRLGVLNPQALNGRLGRRLWERSEEMVAGG
jgi:NAD(P)-dependent dehydrogenase (short-subunit alcohol dehydrogenase family)